MLIDFDDAGFGGHMFELATALYFTIDDPGSDEFASLFQGHRSRRSLPDSHAVLLPLFLFLRGTAYLGWMESRPPGQIAPELARLLIDRCYCLARAYLLDLDQSRLNQLGS